MLDEESNVAVADAGDVDTQTLKEMERFVKKYYKSEEITFPQEWMGVKERAAFSRTSESLLGEQRSDRWLQGVVFKKFGEDYFDVDKPLTDEEQQEASSSDEFPAFGPLPVLFLQNYDIFIDKLVRRMCNMQRYSSDVEQIQVGMMSGIAYALNPPKAGNMDQRLNFFALHPKNLSLEVIQTYVKDDSKARQIFLRVSEALKLSKFTLKRDADITGAERDDKIRSVEFCRSKHHGLKDEFLAALTTVAEDSFENAEDGLLSYLTKIVKTAGCADLEKFIAFHISKRTLSAWTKEGKRKEREVSIYYENGDGEAHSFDKEITVTEEVEENGVVRRTSAANRHTFQREETYEEKSAVAEKAKEYTSSSLEGTARLTEVIIRELRDEAIKVFDEKDRLGKAINDSDCLGLILPEALYYYVQAAIAQVDVVINANNEESAERMRKLGMRLAYRHGRSQVVFKESGQRDLASLVDLDCLEQQLAPYREHKRQICQYWREGKTAEVIASEIDCDLKFVEDTIRQIRLIDKPRRSKSGDKRSAEETFERLTASFIKNGFSWWWCRILTIIYVPLKNDPHNDKVKAELEAWCAAKKRPMPQDDSEYPMLFRRRLRRRYHLIDSTSLSDLKSLLTVHSFIKEGSIPKRAYAEEERDELCKIQDLNARLKAIKNIGGTQPGAAWGHNSNRVTGESNLRMFYDVFMNGMQRDNPSHKEIRLRAALIIKMRRAKARNHGGRSSSGTNEESDSLDSSDMQ